MIEMIDGEPPYFNHRPMEAMSFIRDHNPSQLKHPDKVRREIPNSPLVYTYLRNKATLLFMIGQVAGNGRLIHKFDGKWSPKP